MKKLLAILTDINGTEHVSELVTLPDAPASAKQAENIIMQLVWIKVQDDRILNMDHVVTFKIIEK